MAEPEEEDTRAVAATEEPPGTDSGAAPGAPPLVLRIGWTLLGLAFVALGAVGIVVPGLPTTPFLLLAAACFARGSRRLEAWLLADPVFGPLIRDYREARAVPLRAKVLALVLMWGFVTYALWLGIPAGKTVARVVVATAALSGTAYLLSLRTKR